MPEDLCRDTPDGRIAVVEPVESGADRRRVLLETAKGLFFTVKEMRIARP